jgi:thioredoxin:protein disulfide reductase
MKNFSQKTFLCLLLCSTMIINAVQFSSSINSIDKVTQKVTVNFALDDNEIILANSLQASIDNPALTAEKIDINIPAIKQYVPDFKQKKHIYTTNFQASIIVHNKSERNHTIDSMLHLSYLSTLNSSILDVQIPVHFASSTQPDDVPDFRTSSTIPMPIDEKIESENQSWTARLQNLVEKTQSPWAQILFALLLGLLLSLTPCIYPMIPITIGILHSQGRKSLFHDFLGSLCYACGLATTFACLGLLATVAGSSFGSLLSHPPFVVGLVLFIGYMSLTMIGIIDMYIPSFMKGEVKLYKNFGPFFASYLFGAISGTIASPCVSPGLALLLSIVATMGSKILGFLLLFAFGIGLSIPLIVIGTFSNSLYLLPKSGMWMVEIKKALGFFMMATCFYYLSNILPIEIVYWLFTAFTLFMATFYLRGAHNDNMYKNLYTSIGIVMIGLTIFMATKSYEKTFYQQPATHHASVNWQPNYTIALDQAQKTNKLLLVDFWANHCTMCKAIDKKVFQNELFCAQTDTMVTFVKIDATQSNNSQYVQLKEQYKVYAQPTILLIDPATQTVLRKWTTEPYNMKIEEFIEQIKNIKK